MPTVITIETTNIRLISYFERMLELQEKTHDLINPEIYLESRFKLSGFVLAIETIESSDYVDRKGKKHKVISKAKIFIEVKEIYIQYVPYEHEEES